MLLTLAADLLVIPLHRPDPAAAPDQEKSAIGPNDTERRISNVSRPTRTAHLAGAFRHLAIDKEGHDAAKWLNTFGVSAFVLTYRAGLQAKPDHGTNPKR